MRVLKGYGIGYTKAKKNQKVSRESDIFTNFKHYGFNLPQILRSDINHPAFRKSGFFDSIVCDPPYGHRAFSRKTGMEDDRKAKRERRLIAKYGKLLKDCKDTEEAKQAQIEMEKEIAKLSLSDNEDDELELELEEDEDEAEGEGEEEKVDIDTQMENINGLTTETPEKNMVYLNKEGQIETYHFAPLKMCPIEIIFENLLKLGDLALAKGRCLVCLYPTKQNKGEEE
jgi:hypothetical protein